MRPVGVLSELALSGARGAAVIHILLLASLLPKCYAENLAAAIGPSTRSVVPAGTNNSGRDTVVGSSEINLQNNQFIVPKFAGNGLHSAASVSAGNQTHAPVLLTIADQLNVKIMPYDNPLYVMLPLGSRDEMVTLKAVLNDSMITSDDKAAGDLYDFKWEIIDMPAEAKQQTHTNYSESNKAWASFTNLVLGNYTIRLAASRRASDTVVSAANDSASPPAVLQHTAALGDALKTIVVRKSIVASTPSIPPSLTLSNRSAGAGATQEQPVVPNHLPIAEISPAGPRKITKSGSDVVFADVSKDNDAGDSIVERKWSVLSAPAGYTFAKNISQNSALLKLNNLPLGEYVFQLTVKDSRGATNSTTVRVIAAYEDRPPVAFVGGDSVVHLSESSPETNTVTLDGSKSSDDNGIMSYEWTRINHLDETLDVKGANKPVLTVSGFQHLGDYIFNLTVKDSSSQVDTHQVHVAVVKSDDDEPRAVVGDDLTVMAPVQVVLLNGTLSKPQGKLSFMWTQAAGPSRVVIENADRPVANAKNFLVPGEYQFQLEVKHASSGKKSETKFKVMVNQGVNKPPVADAGPDRQVSLPFPVFSVNGSTSSDDLGIEYYTWLVDDNNPAGATVVGNSQHESVLTLRGLVAGIHKFHLTVSDAQRLSSNASVKIEVLPDKFELDRVELVIKPSVFTLRQSDINDIEHALFLILSHADNNIFAGNSSSPGNTTSYYNIFIDAVETDRMGGIIDLTKKVDASKNSAEEVKVVDGLTVVKQLRQHFSHQKSKQLMRFDVLLVDTFVCRNPCSGHGECNNATKRCHCHMFWWPSPIRALTGDGQSNCDWSTFYVVLLGLILVVLALAVAYGFLSKRHLLEAKDFVLNAANKVIATSKSAGVGGDNSGSDSTKKVGGSQRPRRRRYRLLDNSPSPVNDAEDNSIAVTRPRRKSARSNGGTAVIHSQHFSGNNDDDETSLEMTRRQYYSGRREQPGRRNRSAFNSAYDEDEDDDDESDSETLYDAASSRRLVRPSEPQSALIDVIDEPARQRVLGNGAFSTSGDIATFGSGGSSRNQSASSPVVRHSVMNETARIATSPTQPVSTQLGGKQQNRNQSSSNLSGSYDSGMVLT